MNQDYLRCTMYLSFQRMKRQVHGTTRMHGAIRWKEFKLMSCYFENGIVHSCQSANGDANLTLVPDLW